MVVGCKVFSALMMSVVGSNAFAQFVLSGFQTSVNKPPIPSHELVKADRLRSQPFLHNEGVVMVDFSVQGVRLFCAKSVPPHLPCV